MIHGTCRALASRVGLGPRFVRLGDVLEVAHMIEMNDLTRNQAWEWH